MKLDDHMMLTLKFESWRTGKYQSEQEILFTLRDYVYTTYGAVLYGNGDYDWHLHFENPRDETFFRLTHSC